MNYKPRPDLPPITFQTVSEHGIREIDNLTRLHVKARQYARTCSLSRHVIPDDAGVIIEGDSILVQSWIVVHNHALQEAIRASEARLGKEDDESFSRR